MTGPIERDRPVEEALRVLNDGAATGRVIGPCTLLAVVLADDVGAVQRIVEAAPARIRRIQGETRVADGNHQLRTGNIGDFRVDVRRAYREVVTGLLQVADGFQERHVLGVIVVAAGTGEMPVVDLFLQAVAGLQEFTIDRREVVDQRLEAGPEGGRLHVDSGQELSLDKVDKRRVDAETADFAPAVVIVAHDTCFLCDELFFLGAAFHCARR